MTLDMAKMLCMGEKTAKASKHRIKTGQCAEYVGTVKVQTILRSNLSRAFFVLV